MGNTSSLQELGKEYEHRTGKKLIRAIKADSRQHLDECMEIIKQELISQRRKIEHDKEFEMLQEITKSYLTRGYDIGDGVLFTKTPLEIAEANNSLQAKTFIMEKLDVINRYENLSRPTVNNNTAGGNSKDVVNKARVAEAKERLKKFQQERKKP